MGGPPVTENCVDARCDRRLPGALRRREQQVRHRELGVMDRIPNQTGRLQPPLPDLPRNVCLNPCPIPLAGNLSGAMAHLGQRFQRPFDIAVRRLPVPLYTRHNRAGIPNRSTPKQYTKCKKPLIMSIEPLKKLLLDWMR